MAVLGEFRECVITLNTTRRKLKLSSFIHIIILPSSLLDIVFEYIHDIGIGGSIDRLEMSHLEGYVDDDGRSLHQDIQVCQMGSLHLLQCLDPSKQAMIKWALA